MPRRRILTQAVSGLHQGHLALLVTLIATFLGWSAAPSAASSVGEKATLSEAVRDEGIRAMVESNYLGLSPEAQRLRTWFSQHHLPFTLDPGDRWVEDSKGHRTRVSVLIARTLIRLNQWYGLAAPETNPITHEQLKAAALSPSSVARIQRIFEQAISRGVALEGAWISPESGGEAVIDADLKLAEAENAGWDLVRRLAKAEEDPNALTGLYKLRPGEMARLDRHQLLKLALERFRLTSRGAAGEVRRAVRTLVENSASTFSHEPAEQFVLIAATEWHGRYVGRWHTHPPHDRGGEWTGGDGPSFEDMQNAIVAGQYLTLAFQPEGFDLYDAAAMADAGRVDLTLMRVIRYRSDAWTRHFKNLRRQKR